MIGSENKVQIYNSNWIPRPKTFKQLSWLRISIPNKSITRKRKQKIKKLQNYKTLASTCHYRHLSTSCSLLFDPPLESSSVATTNYPKTLQALHQPLSRTNHFLPTTDAITTLPSSHTFKTNQQLPQILAINRY